MEIVIASFNLHKIREFRALLKNLKRFDVLSLSQFADIQLPEESYATFQENACQKAVAAAEQTKHFVLADDSGIVVPALGGKPGVHSRRYAGRDATDVENRQKLLQEMHHLTGDERTAYYECCLALASPDGLIKSVTSTCEGLILSQPRGREGFGYDSLFIKHDYDKSFGEIAETTKNRISHRYKAFEKMLPVLETL